MALFTDEVKQKPRQVRETTKPTQPNSSDASMCTNLITWSGPSSPVWVEDEEKSRSTASIDWASFSEEQSRKTSVSSFEDNDWTTFQTNANSYSSCNASVHHTLVKSDPATQCKLDRSSSFHTKHRTECMVNAINKPQDLVLVNGLVNGHSGIKNTSLDLKDDKVCTVTSPEEWLEFTFGGDTKPTRSETMFTEPPSHQYESTTSDDVDFRSKPRSTSLPAVASEEVWSDGSLSSRVFSDCFRTDETSNVEVSPLSNIHSVIDQRFWSILTAQACSPDPPTAGARQSLTTIEEKLVDTMYSEESCSISQDMIDLGTCDQEDFDWTVGKDPDPDTVSLDLQPSLFRSKPQTPIDIEFDHSRAALGLSILSVSELQKMCDEMSSKFTKLSEGLVTDLQQRDFLVHQMELKNRFISAMLRVQNLRHAVTSISNGSSHSGSDGAAAGRTTGKGRSWSVRNSVRNAMKHREEKSSGKFLQSIIPYIPPEGLHWSVSTLQQLTKILQAIAEDSDTVPALVADYLQSEVLKSPIREKTPPLLYSCEDSFTKSSTTTTTTTTTTITTSDDAR